MGKRIKLNDKLARIQLDFKEAMFSLCMYHFNLMNDLISQQLAEEQYKDKGDSEEWKIGRI